MQENLLSYRASTLEEKGENLNKIHQLKLKVCRSHRSWQRRPERQNNSVSPTFSSQSEKKQPNYLTFRKDCHFPFLSFEKVRATDLISVSRRLDIIHSLLRKQSHLIKQVSYQVS